MALLPWGYCGSPGDFIFFRFVYAQKLAVGNGSVDCSRVFAGIHVRTLTGRGLLLPATHTPRSFISRLIGWFAGWLADLLDGWSAGWLDGWLVYPFLTSLSYLRGQGRIFQDNLTLSHYEIDAADQICCLTQSEYTYSVTA